LIRQHQSQEGQRWTDGGQRFPDPSYQDEAEREDG
jgi:hypothetical protein